MRLYPSKKQWNQWSLPSKFTIIGTYIGVLGLIIAILPILIDNNKTSDFSTKDIDISELKKTHDRVTMLFVEKDYEELKRYISKNATQTLGGTQVHVEALNVDERKDGWKRRTRENDNFCNGGVHKFPDLPSTLYKCMKMSYKEFPKEINENAFNEKFISKYLVQSLKVQKGDYYGFSTLFDYNTPFGYGVILGFKYILEDGKWKIQRILFDS